MPTINGSTMILAGLKLIRNITIAPNIHAVPTNNGRIVSSVA